MKAKRMRDKAKDAAYYAANKERIAAYYRMHAPAYREANKERIAAYYRTRGPEYRAANKERIAAYRAANKEKIATYRAAYRAANKERIAAYRAANKEKIAAYCAANKDKKRTADAAYRAANKDKKRKYTMQRYYADPKFRLITNLRSRLGVVLKQRGIKKSFQSHARLLGCTAAEARAHIESQFEPWMTWENHGKFGWHIDHIKPLTAFDLTDPVQVAKACHYKNLRPLHWRENIIKGAKTL